MTRVLLLQHFLFNYNFINYNVIKRLMKHNKYTLSIFKMHVHKIVDNKNDSLNNLFSISSTSTTIISETKEAMQDNLSLFDNFVLFKLIHKYKKVF